MTCSTLHACYHWKHSALSERSYFFNTFHTDLLSISVTINNYIFANRHQEHELRSWKRQKVREEASQSIKIITNPKVAFLISFYLFTYQNIALLCFILGNLWFNLFRIARQVFCVCATKLFWNRLMASLQCFSLYKLFKGVPFPMVQWGRCMCLPHYIHYTGVMFSLPAMPNVLVAVLLYLLHNNRSTAVLAYPGYHSRSSLCLALWSASRSAGRSINQDSRWNGRSG